MLLQCVAVCCSVLQVAVAVCCNMLQCVACAEWSRFNGWDRHTELVWCSVVPCVALWCGVLQCVAVCCNDQDWYVDRVYLRWSLWLEDGVLQRVTVCCSVVQCVAVCCSVLPWLRLANLCLCTMVSLLEDGLLQSVAVCGSMLQYVAVCCSVLQCVALISLAEGRWSGCWKDVVLKDLLFLDSRS